HSPRLGEIDAGLADIAAADGRLADARALYTAALAALGPAPTVTRLRLLRGLARVDPSYADAARQLASTMPDVAP
ncbi:MAG TPA: hypothetical protein VGO00_02495, partial [Kofleriaceae bacterium]|nr:hypothetical protein [Kofleriaceae bacterium]